MKSSSRRRVRGARRSAARRRGRFADLLEVVHARPQPREPLCRGGLEEGARDGRGASLTARRSLLGATRGARQACTCTVDHPSATRARTAPKRAVDRALAAPPPRSPPRLRPARRSPSCHPLASTAQLLQGTEMTALRATRHQITQLSSFSTCEVRSPPPPPTPRPARRRQP